MNKTLMSVFQIATLLFSVASFAAVEKGQHEGLLLDSRIKFAVASSHEVEAKVILSGDDWTLVARTPTGNILYGRTEKAPVVAGADDEAIRVSYREVNAAGAEIGVSAAAPAPAIVELKDAHIESRVSKIRYQID